MIKQINIRGLFDRYDYIIPLHSTTDDTITFITGCNGMGKSTILRMLNTMYQTDWDKFVLYPFHVFQVIFDTCTMTFRRDYEPTHQRSMTEDPNARNRADYVLRVDFTQNGKTTSYDIGRWDDNYHNTPSDISMTLMLDKPHFIDDQRLSFSYDEYGNLTTPHRLSDCRNDCKKRLEELKSFVNDRLSPFYTSPYDQEDNSSTDVQLIEMYNRLIQWGIINAKPVTDHEASRSNLSKVIDGMRLLECELNHSDRNLNTYRNISELESLIRSYDFDHKVMNLHVNTGFRFKSSEGLLLDLDQLSSGEQQILLQSYELLINASRDSLVLIDEPETSQHVAWQMDYCEHLQTIARTRHLQCIVATHLPLMFDNDFSLSVDLYSLANPEEA